MEAIKECSTAQAWEHWSSFSFATDNLIFHPQMAEDCGWRGTVSGFYEVCASMYVFIQCVVTVHIM